MDAKKRAEEERDKIIKGLDIAYRRLIEYKKYKKSPMIIMRNGKVVAVDPHEMEPTSDINDEEAKRAQQ